ATEGGSEGAVRAGGTAAGTVGERGGPAADGQGPQQVGVQGQAVRVAAFGQGAQRTGEQQVLLGGGLAGDVGETGGGLHHRSGGGVAGVVRAECAPVRGQRLHLGDHVQAAADVQLDVDHAERLEPGAELRGSAAYPFGQIGRAHV